MMDGLSRASHNRDKVSSQRHGVLLDTPYYVDTSLPTPSRTMGGYSCLASAPCFPSFTGRKEPSNSTNRSMAELNERCIVLYLSALQIRREICEYLKKI